MKIHDDDIKLGNDMNGKINFIHLCRTKFRKEMNSLDSQAGAVVIDSLINYETVKVLTLTVWFKRFGLTVFGSISTMRNWKWIAMTKSWPNLTN